MEMGGNLRRTVIRKFETRLRIEARNRARDVRPFSNADSERHRPGGPGGWQVHALLRDMRLLGSNSGTGPGERGPTKRDVGAACREAYRAVHGSDR